MDRRLKTDVVKRYSEQINKNITIIRELSTGRRYVYKLKSDNDFYILKGYIIEFPVQKPKIKAQKANFLNFVEKLGIVYQEYFHSKISCAMSPHFTMPLDIGFHVELSEDEFSYTALIIEIIFEYGGDSLENLGKIDVSTAYDLMKQSGDAFNTLHSMGIAHLDIKPGNMVCKNNFLKVIDLGSSYGYNTTNDIYHDTKTISSRIREWTEAFSAPEILKNSVGNNTAETQYELGKTDVYSWAITFFVMLSGRSDNDLVNDAQKYKKTTERAYKEYIEKIIKPEFDKISTNGVNEDNMKKIIKEIIMKQLSYKPSSRSKMNEIVASLKRLQTEKTVQKDLSICKDCINARETKVKLKCGHTMCKRCIRRYVLGKFTKGEPYNYSTVCNICKKQVKLSVIFFDCLCKCRWTDFGKSIEINIDHKGCVNHGRCKKGGLIGCVDSYLVQDIKTYQTVYSYYSRYMKNHASNTILDLSCKNIECEGAKAIADSLKNNRILIELNICNNEIGYEGAKAIADSLKNNKSLNILDIGSNEIGYEGAKAIADSLKNNEKLTELYIYANEIGDKGSEAIADSLQNNKSLTILDLGSNKLGHEGAKAIADSLENNKTLVSLIAYNNKVEYEGAKAIADSLQNNKKLIELIICENEIGDEGAKVIADSLKNNKSLTKLDVSSNEIGPKGAKVIADSLKKNESLTNLYISSNKIGDGGAKAIADLLKNNKKLTELNISNNKIGYEGAKAIAGSLKYNISLAELDIDSNQIRDEYAKVITNSLKNNGIFTKLAIDANSTSAEEKN